MYQYSLSKGNISSLLCLEAATLLSENKIIQRCCISGNNYMTLPPSAQSLSSSQSIYHRILHGSCRIFAERKFDSIIQNATYGKNVYSYKLSVDNTGQPARKNVVRDTLGESKRYTRSISIKSKFLTEHNTLSIRSITLVSYTVYHTVLQKLSSKKFLPNCHGEIMCKQKSGRIFGDCRFSTL